MVINGFGALLTAIVAMVFAITKFRDGAWIVLILIPLIVFFPQRHPSPLSQTWPQTCRWSNSARRRACTATG